MDIKKIRIPITIMADIEYIPDYLGGNLLDLKFISIREIGAKTLYSITPHESELAQIHDDIINSLVGE
jgi:hypothetical protein